MKNILKYNSFYLLGIKGVAMTNIALILKQMGKQVYGIDSKDTFITDEVLQSNNITFSMDNKKELQSPLSDVYVFSAAHNGSENPILKHALKQGKIIISQAELIEQIRAMFPISIAVSGCHGKTTTSSLLAYSLTKLKKNPTYIVGTASFEEMNGGHYQKYSEYFVFEADEYGTQPPRDLRPKLLFYNPQYILCTNIDFDHPDVYTNIDEVKNTFLTFFSNHTVFLCVDDPHIQSLLSKLKREQYKTFGFSDGADLQLFPEETNNVSSTFSAIYLGKKLGVFSIGLFGNKNISNAGGVILTLLELGFSADCIKKAIVKFKSIKRRLELVYKNKNITLFDDYAHHPAEIEATILALRKRYKKNRIIILFQPHTFSRTEMFKKQIILALSKADSSYIAPIFSSARENVSDFTVNSQELNTELQSSKINNVTVCGSDSEMLKRLDKQINSKDIIVTMGAGDIYKLKDDIIKLINTYEK